MESSRFPVYLLTITFVLLLLSSPPLWFIFSGGSSGTSTLATVSAHKWNANSSDTFPGEMQNALLHFHNSSAPLHRRGNEEFFTDFFKKQKTILDLQSVPTETTEEPSGHTRTGESQDIIRTEPSSQHNTAAFAPVSPQQAADTGALAPAESQAAGLLQMSDDASSPMPPQAGNGKPTVEPAWDSAYDAPGFDNLVHIAVTSATWGREPFTQNETEILIKSLLIYSKCPLHITILADNSSASKSLAFLEAASKVKSFSYTILHLDDYYDYVEETIGKQWGINMNHHEGTAGYAKFLWPQIFPPTVKRVIAFDTDMIAGADICELWEDFGKSKPTTLFAFTRKPHIPLCPCIGLLHLDRMRAAGWLLPGQSPDTTNPASAYNINFTEFFQKHSKSNYKSGDQTMLVVLWEAHKSKFPEMLQQISRSWDLEHCEGYYGVFPSPLPSGVNSSSLSPLTPPFTTTSSKDRSLVFKVVHFNCFFNKNPKLAGVYDEITLEAWGIVWKWVRDLNWNAIKLGANGTKVS